MAFRVIFFKGSEVRGSTPWNGDFGSAKQHAISHFHIQSKQRGVTSVNVIVDGDPSKVLFEFPAKPSVLDKN